MEHTHVLTSHGRWEESQCGALLAHVLLDLLDGARDERGEHLVPVLRHQHVVLDADAAEAVEAHQLVLDEELAEGGVLEGGVEHEVVEVDAGLHGEDHAGLQHSAGAQARVAGVRQPLHAALVAADVVGVEPEAVPEAVRHEERAEVHLHHLVDVAGDDAGLLEPLEDDAVRERVHVLPVHAGLHRRDDAAVRREHDLVQLLLDRRELAVRREGRREVAVVAAVLRAHVVQDEVAVADLLRVGRAGVPVVQDRAVPAAAADRRERAAARAAVEVRVVEERRLELVLHHAGLDGLHDAHVRAAGDADDVAHHFDLLLRLDEAALVEHPPERVLLDGVLLDAVERRGVGTESRVRVDVVDRVDRRGLQLLDNLGKFVNKVALFQEKQKEKRREKERLFFFDNKKE